ncbi:MAG: hypothetical protein FWE43_01110 [Streptococcaceae bacterium]|nr:hypothetical protein [Streptococcaceae bacterium]MCL2681076.1 hypothetical protein [Streptococcaceae bacterium]
MPKETEVDNHLEDQNEIQNKNELLDKLQGEKYGKIRALEDFDREMSYHFSRLRRLDGELFYMNSDLARLMQQEHDILNSCIKKFTRTQEDGLNISYSERLQEVENSIKSLKGKK